MAAKASAMTQVGVPMKMWVEDSMPVIIAARLVGWGGYCLPSLRRVSAWVLCPWTGQVT